MYKFVFKDDGWWLKISSIEELDDYYTNTEENPFLKTLGNGAVSLAHCPEFYVRNDRSETIGKHVNNVGFALGMYASTRQLSIPTATKEFIENYVRDQVDLVTKGYTIYINRKGAYHWTDGTEKNSNWYESTTLTFPELKEDAIKIEKFPLGNHYYAYIGKMQVRDGDTLKWNTYQEAYEAAKKQLTC